MADKVLVVTGGNAGIGFAIVDQLAAMGGHVVMISRDSAKGAAAADVIRTRHPGGTLDVVQGDVGTTASTKDLATRLLGAYPRIDVLINNAGVWPTKRFVNTDGLETAFAVNHMGPYILSRMLLPRLRETAPARIVNVNAGLYVNGKLDLAVTPYGHAFSPLRTYADSKLCNMLFTAELARRIEGSGVTINANHPGVIRTELGVPKGPLGPVLRLVKRFWGTPEEGAKAPVWLATSDELAGVSGRYYFLQKETAMNDTARDEALAQGLWDFSAEAAGLSKAL